VKLETTQLAVTSSAVSSPVKSVSTATSNPVSPMQSPLQSPYNGHSRNSSATTVLSPHVARHMSTAGKLMLVFILYKCVCCVYLHQ
jgi:hypothetical protein